MSRFPTADDADDTSHDNHDAFHAGTWDLGSEPPTMQPIVLPEISGPELVDTLQRVHASECKLTDPETFAMQVAQVQTIDDSMLVRTQEFSVANIQQSLAESGVSFAGGESDEESIRDFEDGRSKTRWHRRKPYFCSA